MSYTPDSQRVQSDFATNEGGCARLFLIVLAVLSPLLGITVSIVYRTMGYAKMATMLLRISLVILLLQLIVGVAVLSTVGAGLESLLGSFT